MRVSENKKKWQNFKEKQPSGSVNHRWRDPSCNEAAGITWACFSSFPHAFPTPSSPIPQRGTPLCPPHDPPGSSGLYQWELYSCIPSQRQEPPGLVRSIPLPVMLLNTNRMLGAEWFHITELQDWQSTQYAGFNGSCRRHDNSPHTWAFLILTNWNLKSRIFKHLIQFKVKSRTRGDLWPVSPNEAGLDTQSNSLYEHQYRRSISDDLFQHDLQDGASCRSQEEENIQVVERKTRLKLIIPLNQPDHLPHLCLRMKDVPLIRSIQI